jgi:hypothetical protein
MSTVPQFPKRALELLQLYPATAGSTCRDISSLMMPGELMEIGNIDGTLGEGRERHPGNL